MELPPAILCIGQNYAEHAIEMGHKGETELVLFMKNPASLIANGDSIVIPTCCEDEVDYEGELAVFIAEDCKDISIDEAMSYVAGYAVANDVSARVWQKQKNGGQYIRGKSFDTFCPLTQMIDANKVKDPQSLAIKTTLNGNVMQESSTARMIRGVAELISDLSTDMTLLKGTILLTGTPSGVGVARNPKVFLQDGDKVTIEIESVGTLTNTVSKKRS